MSRWKKMYLAVAEQLCYTEEVLKQLEGAVNERQAEIILHNARCNGLIDPKKEGAY